MRFYTYSKFKVIEHDAGTLHIKPPATPVDIGDYFVVWADEVTIAQNLFNRLVGFWIQK